MVLTSILQYINGEWVQLGEIRGGTLTKEFNNLDDLEKKLNSTTDNIITIRQDVKSLLIINLNNGPVRLTVRD